MKLSAAVTTLVSVLACVSLISCTHAPYQAPTSGPTAQLKIPGSPNTAVGIFEEGKRCANRSWMSGDKYSSFSKQGVTQTIPANKLVTLYFYSFANNRSCAAAVSFKPQAKQDYVFSSLWEQKGMMNVLANTDVGRCTYQITNASTHQAVDLTLRNYQASVLSKTGCNDSLAEDHSDLPEVKQVVIQMNFKNWE